MGCESTSKLALFIVENTDFFLHLKFVSICSRLNEWPIEMITVESSEHGWFGLPDMSKELFKKRALIRLVKHSKRPNIVVFSGSVLKITDIFADHLPVSNQEA